MNDNKKFNSTQLKVFIKHRINRMKFNLNEFPIHPFVSISRRNIKAFKIL